MAILQDKVFDIHGSLLSVTSDSLIELLIANHTYSLEQTCIFAALLNIRIFISPADLLQKVLQVCFNSCLIHPTLQFFFFQIF